MPSELVLSCTDKILYLQQMRAP